MLIFGLCTAVLICYLCTAVLIFGLCMHTISTASSVTTAVICTIKQLCFVLVCAGTKLAQLHQPLAPICKFLAWALRTSLFLPVCETMEVFYPINMYVLWNHKMNVTFEGLTGNCAAALFCREFKYCWIYAFSVLIFWVQKCACANSYAFCMSDFAPFSHLPVARSVHN